MIQQTFQQYSTLKEEECMVKFFKTYGEFINFNEEVFPCELVVSSKLIYLYTFENYLGLKDLDVMLRPFSYSKAGA